MGKFPRLLAVVAAATLPSCLAGPNQLGRSVDDWDQRLYTNSPWWNATLWVIPVIPVAAIGAFVCDTLVGNAHAFWFRDAWAGDGTGFRSADFAPVDGAKQSLLNPASEAPQAVDTPPKQPPPK